MHGEAADKPRYSFNFRVGLGRWGGKRKGRKGEAGRKGEGGKNGRGRLIKRANVALGGEAGAFGG